MTEPQPSQPQPSQPQPTPWGDTAPSDYARAALAHRAVRRVGGLKPVSLLLARTLHHVDRPVLRATSGRHTLTSLITGLTVADLETTGARSGQPRRTPVLGFPTEGGFVVIASNYGRRQHPAWYHNLVAEPAARLHLRGVATDVRAELTAGAQRERIWAQAVRFYPSWDRYAERAAHRSIGVFLLRPRG
jgi:deazaflavin-dependent oxidoreductase (nitroreductase family)